MATVRSDVDVCNMALAFIGTDRILSLDEDTKRAKLCALYYPIERDEEIAKHDWSFATFRQNLATPVETNYTDYSYMYQLPEDPYCLRPIEIDGAPNAAWKVEGRYLYTNQDEVELIYIGQVTDPRKYTPGFAKLLSLKLAINLASVFTGKDKKVNQVAQMYEIETLRAQGSDSIAGRNKIYPSQRWDEVGWT